MIKRFFFILFLCFSYQMESQNWDSISRGRFNWFVERTLVDSVHNILIVSGKHNAKVGNLSARGICSWNGTNWDSLAGGINTHDQVLNPQNPGGMVLTCIPYNGKLLVGGYFTSIGTLKSTGIALWNGIDWDSLPNRAFRYDKQCHVDDFLKKGNLLYLVGNFDTIAGQPSKGLATWDGTNFNAITLPIGPGFQNISSIIEYKNELYIGGDGFLVGPNNNARDIFKFNGSNWISTTGNGLYGTYAGIADLQIYNNELYASGHFTKADGNPGNHIMKWNGNQWKDVGFGDQLTFVNIKKMLVYHNKLWVFGGFDEVAGSFASNVAVYDGVNWCGLKDTLDNTINSATVYNDTIYIGGGFWKANSDSVKFIAKLKDPALYNTCVNVGIDEQMLGSKVRVYPNPATLILHFSDDQNELQNASIDITNSIGQSVVQIPFSSTIDVSTLSTGCYFITITTSRKSVLHAKFIKE